MTYEEKRVHVQGITITYKTAGHGIPIIVLHGWGGSSDSWKSFIEQFSLKEYQLIVLDLPGFGKSNNPPVAWSVNDYVHLILDIAEKLSLPSFILVGHSFGGRISIKLASRNKEKVKALVLIAAAGIKHKKTLKQHMGNSLAKYGKKIASLPIVNNYFTSLRTLLYRILKEKDYVQTKGTLKETFKKVIAEDLTNILPSINVPTLIIWGTADTYVPVSDAYIMHDKINGSVLEIIEGGKHGLHLQMPKRIVTLIQHFIAQ